jgi:hypothetical protein
MYKKNYTFIWLCIIIVIHLNCQTKYSKMKTSKNHNQYVNQLSVIIPRNNGTQAGVSALAESLKRGLAK